MRWTRFPLLRSLGGVALGGLLASCLMVGLTAANVELKRGQDQVEVYIGGQLFTTYYFSADVAKPYLMPLRTPAGVVAEPRLPRGQRRRQGRSEGILVRAAPAPTVLRPRQYRRPGFLGRAGFRQILQRPRQGRRSATWRSRMSNSKPPRAACAPRFRLEDPNRRVIGEESQTYTFGGDAQTRVIDCEYILHATAGPLVLGDTKEGTFGIRLRKELSAPNDHMINSNGAHGEPPFGANPPIGSPTRALSRAR